MAYGVALLNTPHPSGKLVRWGLASQEVDLKIHYRPIRTHKVADALSQPQLVHNVTSEAQSEPSVQQEGTVNQLMTTVDDQLLQCQDSDPLLVDIKRYNSSGDLPSEEEN